MQIFIQIFGGPLMPLFHRVGFLAAALLILITGVASAHECETSCSSRCTSTVIEYDRIVQANRDYCGASVPNCIPRCKDRYSDGSCRQYDPDYCGRDPHCVAQCNSRY